MWTAGTDEMQLDAKDGIETTPGGTWRLYTTSYKRLGAT